MTIRISKEGTIVKTTGRIASVPVGDGLIGRIVDPTGKPLDGKGEFPYTKTRPIERVAPGIVTRKSVHEPLQTGLTAIDALTPIGRGQRELIIWRPIRPVKLQLRLIQLLTKKVKNVICIYVAIGQKASTVAHLAKTLEEKEQWIIQLLFPQQLMNLHLFNILHHLQGLLSAKSLWNRVKLY